MQIENLLNVSPKYKTHTNLINLCRLSELHGIFVSFGMEKHDKESSGLKHIAHEALHDLVHFDTRLFRTIPALLFKPGEVTVGSLEAGQIRYVRPFALFVFLNFLFFIVKARQLFQYHLAGYRDRFGDIIVRKAAEMHISQATLEERFNTAMHFEQKEYFIVMVPLFALILWLISWTPPRFYALHLVFALNFYSFLIAFLIIMPYLVRVLLLIPHADVVIDTERAFAGIWLVVFFVYLGIAVRKVYRFKRWRAWLSAAILSCAALSLIVLVYWNLMFFIVMHSIGE